MAQTLRPDGTLASGLWTATGAATLHEAIDETTVDDTDFIDSDTKPSNDICRFSLSDPGATPGDGDWTIRIWASKDGNAGIDVRIDFTLQQGSSDLGGGTAVLGNQNDGAVLYSYTLSAAEKANITDATDLNVKIDAYTVGGGAGKAARLYMVETLVPDSSGTPKADTDSGSGAEGTETLTVEVADTDTGSGTDVVAARDLAATDAGSGADAETLDQGQIEKSDTDTGSGADVVALVAELTDSDTGAGGDEATDRDLTGTDTGSGGDSATLDQGEVNKTDTDTGSGLEDDIYRDEYREYGPLLDVAVSDSDTGSGTETETLDQAGVAKSDSDSGTGTDAEALSVDLSASETGSSTESHTGAAELADSDTGASAEGQTLDAEDVKADSDAGAGIEAQALTVDLTDTDAGSGAEVAVLVADIGVGDDATGTEVETLDTGDVELSDSDAGTALDALAARDIHVTDVGAGTEDDVPEIDGKTMTVSDSGVGIDNVKVVAGYVQPLDYRLRGRFKGARVGR